MPLFLLLFCFLCFFCSFSFSFLLLRHFSRPALRPDCSSSGNSVRSWSWSCVSETRFLIDFRQTTDLKNATRYEQKIKKRKKRKKTVKIASSKKKKENTLRNDVSRDVHRKCQARAKKKRHDVDVDDASSDVAASSDCVHVCLLCATSRWLCGEGALPASTATTTATATLTLLTWTWTWRLTGVFGASWARFMAAFCCCFFSLPASLLFSFRFFCTFLGTRF